MKKNNKKTKINPALVAVALTASSLLVVPSLQQSIIRAQSINDLRAQAAQLQSQIDANQAEAERLENEGDSLKNVISGLDVNIDNALKQIELTTGKIAQLEQELEQTKQELERQKGLLKANALALYKRGDASAVEMIAGSDSFSQYINEQEYLERIKSGIQDSAKKVKELEEKLEEQRARQKELLAQQEAIKQSLDSARAERASVLAETEGQEAKFRDVVSDLQAKRAAVDKALAAKILAANFVNMGSVEAGQAIGRVGMTGFTFGPHLHFELRNGSFSPINPGGYPLGGMTWPVPSSTNISQYYGCVPQSYYATRCGGGGSLHTGLDIPAGLGSPVVAAKSGIIIHRSNDGDGYGIKIIVKHYDGTYTLYAHMAP